MSGGTSSTTSGVVSAPFVDGTPVVELSGSPVVDPESTFLARDHLWVYGQPVSQTSQTTWNSGEEFSTTKIKRSREALREADEKNCKQIINPEFRGSWFGNLLVCRSWEQSEGKNTKAVFYFLDDADSTKIQDIKQDSRRVPDSLMKKVTSISYGEEGQESAGGGQVRKHI